MTIFKCFGLTRQPPNVNLKMIYGGWIQYPTIILKFSNSQIVLILQLKRYIIRNFEL